MSSESSTVGRRMAKGAAWMVLMRFGRRLIGVINTIILARLLAPEDFGIIVLAASLVAIIEVTGDFNLDLVLIQNQNAGRAHYDTAWTMTIIRGALVGVIIVAIAEPAAGFFEEERIVNVLYVLAATAVLDGFHNVAIVDFFKNLDLAKNFRLMMSARLISFSATIICAFWWRNYWALAVGLVVEGLARTVLSYVMHPYRPRLCLTEWREIFNFSKWLMVSNLGDFLIERLDRFLIAKFLNGQTVGLYSVAAEISNLPTSNLVTPIQRAVFPGFAQIADDRKALVRTYIDSMALVLTLTLPIGLGIWMTSDLIVSVLLGDKWLEAIPLLQILALYGIMRITYANTRPIYMALGRPHYVTLTTAIQLVVLAPLLFFGVWYDGAVGAAWAMVGATAVTGIYNIALVSRMLDIGFLTLPHAIRRTLVAAACMVGTLTLLQMYLPAAADWWLMAFYLILNVAVGAGAYVAVLLAIWVVLGKPEGTEEHIVRLVLERLEQRKARSSQTGA